MLLSRGTKSAAGQQKTSIGIALGADGPRSINASAGAISAGGSLNYASLLLPGSCAQSQGAADTLGNLGLRRKISQYLRKRDYSAMLAALEVERMLPGIKFNAVKLLCNYIWQAFAAFHLGDYNGSLSVFAHVSKETDNFLKESKCNIEDQDNDVRSGLESVKDYSILGSAVCLFYVGEYAKSDIQATLLRTRITKTGGSSHPFFSLLNRIQFHLAHKLGDQKKLMVHHQALQDIPEDQLTLASMHFLRGHYQESVDVYKRLMSEHPEYLAVHVYMALCYYRLDFYDVAQEILTNYFTTSNMSTSNATSGSSFAKLNSVSLTAGNLRACIMYRLFGARVATQELLWLIAESTKQMKKGRNTSANLAINAGSNIASSPSNAGSSSSSFAQRRGGQLDSLADNNGCCNQVFFAREILAHNLCVFLNTKNNRRGAFAKSNVNSNQNAANEAEYTDIENLEGQSELAKLMPCARSVFTRLVDIVVPEGRLNLALLRLRKNEPIKAFDLMREIEPSAPPEYVLKAIACTEIGQTQDSREHIKQAQQYFQVVGSSSSECDTIAGRQSMASCFFLLRNFEDAAIYLDSIKTYFFDDDTFNMNLGQVKAGLGLFAEAETALLAVRSPTIKATFVYRSHLIKSLIMNHRAKQAWAAYEESAAASLAVTASKGANENDDIKNTIGQDAMLVGLLQLIAADCYATEQYIYAARAYNTLEQIDHAPEHWEGKRGACIGVLQQAYNVCKKQAGNSQVETWAPQLLQAIEILSSTRHPQADYILRVIRSWYQSAFGSIQNIAYKHNRYGVNDKETFDYPDEQEEIYSSDEEEEEEEEGDYTESDSSSIAAEEDLLDEHSNEIPCSD